MTICRKVQLGFATISLMFAGLSAFAINQIDDVMTRHLHRPHRARDPDAGPVGRDEPRRH
jgi:hypothetical protein